MSGGAKAVAKVALCWSVPLIFMGAITWMMLTDFGLVRLMFEDGKIPSWAVFVLILIYGSVPALWVFRFEREEERQANEDV